MSSPGNFMQRALELARAGMGRVSPNPMVGAVVVHNDRIIGEGWHRQFGGPHAEVNAIAAVGDPSLLAESTLYVTLEPCNHQGKTPACTALVLQHRIPRVVVACTDPNPLVAGKGISHLREKGVEVEVGLMETEAQELNRRFITFHQKQRPYIILKFAQTADGFLGRNMREVSAAQYQAGRQISGEAANKMVHKWRSEEQAILVGAATAVADDPQLNVRHWEGDDPLRLVLAERPLPAHLRLLNDGKPTVIITGKEQHADYPPSVKPVATQDNVSLMQGAIDYLYRENILSVLVEGGAQTLQQFIAASLWDEARVITAPVFWHNGIAAPVLQAEPAWKEQVGKDILKVYRNPYAA